MVAEGTRMRPARPCDVVMKGGITSGVVYPHAVCELAGTYRLKNVGGTSAGAIAAAAAAAAEYGRERGGFEDLAKLPSEIGAPGKLASLFQPAAATRPLFDLMITAVEHRGRERAPALAKGLLRCFRVPALLGALPGLALIALAWLAAADDLVVAIAMTVAGAVLATIGAYAAVLFRAVTVARAAIPENAYGMCTGMPGVTDAPQEALTPWLEQLIDGLAGRTGGDPLTFGDLWAGPGGDVAAADPDAPWMRLEMVTTNVTNRRAERLPWASDEYYFDGVELRRLFPEAIVRWLEEHPPPVQGTKSEQRDLQLLRGQLWPLRPLPHAADLPVLVATRMSLSFPVLLSAIPLWRVDWTRTANVQARAGWRTWVDAHRDEWEEMRDEPERLHAVEPELARPAAERCWFSDGGISSNFPVHFFDAFLPRHPTFAINLRPFHPDHRDATSERDKVWLADTNVGGISDWWYRFDADLGAFLGGIVRTMQNRVDEAQMRLPGYRDRVVHVSMTDEEGGLNLTMAPPVIEALTERGRWAGKRLVERFAEEPADGAALSWPNHRWVRYRSSLASLAVMLREFARGYGDDAEPTYPGLARRKSDAAPAGYRITGPQRRLALELSKGMATLAKHLDDAPDNARLDAGAPSPPVVARLTPMDPPLRRKGTGAD